MILFRAFQADYYDKIERNGMHILEDWRFIGFFYFMGWNEVKFIKVLSWCTYDEAKSGLHLKI